VTATRADDFLTALVAKAVGLQATTLAGVTVLDGPWPAGATVTDPDFLIIGGDYEPTSFDQPAVTTIPTASPMGNNSFDEAIAVPGVAVSWRGDPNAMATCRSVAIATVEAFQDSLTADPTLGGLLEDQALLAVVGLRQVQTTRGPYCAVNFTVSATALIWNG
jgi:hypothetical protein